RPRRPPSHARLDGGGRRHRWRQRSGVARGARRRARAAGRSRGVRARRARCVATVGLGNRGRVGEPAAPAVHAGTINLLCVTSEPLTEPALVEAISIASSARTAAVLQAGLALPGSDRLATGTGTDCCIVASPLDRARPELAYAGLHTAVGEAIGRAAFVATARGVARWLAAHGDQRRARA